jgi:hypothetical protein
MDDRELATALVDDVADLAGVDGAALGLQAGALRRRQAREGVPGELLRLSDVANRFKEGL